MTVLGWIVFGLIVGIVGKLLMPGKDPGGFFATVAIGIVGALIGGFLGRLVGLYGQDDPVGFVMAVIGAVVFLWLYRVIARRSAV
ncbi:GlsB/YeaQ/YmgE family stress response membrane protein [Nitrospira sp. Nam74]